MLKNQVVIYDHDIFFGHIRMVPHMPGQAKP
jgi:hypothetical protein